MYNFSQNKMMLKQKPHTGWWVQKWTWSCKATWAWLRRTARNFPCCCRFPLLNEKQKRFQTKKVPLNPCLLHVTLQLQWKLFSTLWSALNKPDSSTETLLLPAALHWLSVGSNNLLSFKALFSALSFTFLVLQGMLHRIDAACMQARRPNVFVLHVKIIWV